MSAGRRRFMKVMALAAALALAIPATATGLAQPDDFYKGKAFTIVVGFSPGGGYDAYARVLARHLGEHIPGNPDVIVENMPGAGSLTSVRYLNLTAPADGTVMTTFNPGLVTQSVLEPDKVHLDFRKYAWIGVVTPDFRVCYGFGPKGVRSWADLMQRKHFILGSTAVSSTAIADPSAVFRLNGSRTGRPMCSCGSCKSGQPTFRKARPISAPLPRPMSRDRS